MKILRRSSFLLLEVLIAFMLVVMCAIPLVEPHTAILTEQKRWIRTVQLDHFVNLFYAKITEQLYLNQIDWDTIVSGREVLITQDQMKELIGTPLPFQGKYFFKVKRFKPGGESLYRHYLLSLNFEFLKKGEKKNPLTFTYILFVVRDLSDGQLSEGSDEELEVIVEEEEEGEA